MVSVSCFVVSVVTSVICVPANKYKVYISSSMNISVIHCVELTYAMNDK